MNKSIVFLMVGIAAFCSIARADTNPCLENPFVVDNSNDEAILVSSYECPNVKVVVDVCVSANSALLNIIAGSITVTSNGCVENTGDIELVAVSGNLEVNSGVESSEGDIFLVANGMDLKITDAQISAAGSIVGSSMGNTRLVGGRFTSGKSFLLDVWGNILIAPGLELTEITAPQGDVVVDAEGDVEVRAWIKAKNFKENSKGWLTRLTRSEVYAEKVTIHGGMGVIIDGSLLPTDKHIGMGPGMCVSSMQPCMLIVNSILRTLNPGSTITIKTPNPTKSSSSVAICGGSIVVDGRPNVGPTIGGRNKDYRENVATEDNECARYGLAGAALVE